MAVDLDDLVHERLVARICGRPEPPWPSIEGATLLAPVPGRQCSTPPYFRSGKGTCLCQACRGRNARANRLRKRRAGDTMQAAVDFRLAPTP